MNSTKKSIELIEQVAWNKSSSLPNVWIQNTQTLKLFTKIIKTESTYRCQAEG